MDANKIDVDALFKQYTVKEIQAIELQIKNEIEKKKEDLRIMVYNRYRDIIDAADGIHIMKSCSKQIETVLDELQNTCDNVFGNKENTIFKCQDKLRSIEKNLRNNKYVLAVIIKLLQNSPSKIWFHLDNQEYTQAAKQYLLAQHAHVCIELENNLLSLKGSLNHIQYAKELWISIVFLSKTITTKARETFTDLKIDSSVVLTDAISAIYLLENVNLKEIFEELLRKRTPLLKYVIDLDYAEKNFSIKDRIIKCLKFFVNTVNHIYNLFSDDPDNKFQSFENCINKRTHIIESLKDDGFVISKIPDYLKNFKFKEASNVKRFESNYLHEQANDWLSKCLADLQESLSNAFRYVSNFKNLVEIRDVVIEFEAEIQIINQSEITNQQFTWGQICQKMFKKEIFIWSDLIAPFYYTQSKIIIESSFKMAHENLINNIQDSLSEKIFNPLDEKKMSPEMDINSYIWSMENNQFSRLNSANKNSIDFVYNKSMNSTQAKFLSHNSYQHNITPAVKQICTSLDNDLSKLLEDIEYTTHLPDKYNNNSNVKIIINEDFDRLNEYLEVNLLGFSKKLIKSLNDLITKLSNEEFQKIKKILFICRFTNALVNLSCPSLKTSYNNVNHQYIKHRKNQLAAKFSDTNDVMQMLNAVKKKSILSEQKIIDENWTNFIEEIQKICKNGFQIWIENICSEIKKEYLTEISESSISTNPSLALTDLIAWDEIEIENELNSDPITAINYVNDKSEETTLKSRLHAPLVCSPLIQTILYSLSQELTMNLSYNMIDLNLILRDMILNVFELIIETYQKIVSIQESTGNNQIKLTQNQSLQMLFDLRFLNTLFDIKSFTQSDRNVLSLIQTKYKEITSSLEGFIDPFDYDICSPFIQSNISKSIARSVALYGVINTNERLIRSNSSGSALTSANDKYNLVVLSISQHRFELLPLPSQQSQQQINQKQQNLLLKNQTANLKSDETIKKSSAGKQIAESVNSASAGLSNVLKWFQ